MATTARQPGSIAFLHDFIQRCMAPGTTSQLKGTWTGVIMEAELGNVERFPIMFRCVLPQNGAPRHALLFLRPGMTLSERDRLITNAFSIGKFINGMNGKIEGYRPVWADGHTPPAADVDTFAKMVRLMGERKNGIIEVLAVKLKCEFCDVDDRTKMIPMEIAELGLRPVCLECVQKYYERDAEPDAE